MMFMEFFINWPELVETEYRVKHVEPHNATHVEVWWHGYGNKTTIEPICADPLFLI